MKGKKMAKMGTKVLGRPTAAKKMMEKAMKGMRKPSKKMKY